MDSHIITLVIGDLCPSTMCAVLRCSPTGRRALTWQSWLGLDVNKSGKAYCPLNRTCCQFPVIHDVRSRHHCKRRRPLNARPVIGVRRQNRREIMGVLTRFRNTTAIAAWVGDENTVTVVRGWNSIRRYSLLVVFQALPHFPCVGALQVPTGCNTS